MRKLVFVGVLASILAGCGGGGGGGSGSSSASNPPPSNPAPNPPPNPYVPGCLNGHYFSFTGDVKIVDRQTLQELPKTSDRAYIVQLGQKVYMMVPYSTDAGCLEWSVASISGGNLDIGNGISYENPLKIKCEYLVRADGFQCEAASGGAYGDALLSVEACVQDLKNFPFPGYCDSRNVRISLR